MTFASHPVSGLDHVGFIVRDLDASAALMGDLGFLLTARADHTRTDASGAQVSAGSSQRCVLLREGYIELMQITDPAAGHQLTPATQVRHGLHVLALGTDDATACHAACAAAGVSPGPLLHWSRAVAEGPCRGEARFHYFDARWDAHDPSYVCWVQHLTPELVRPAHLLEHANSARALAAVHYRGPDALARAWVQQLVRAGAQVASTRADGSSLRVGRARIEIDTDAGMQSVRPVAIELAFARLGVLQDRCRQLGLVTRMRQDGRLEVDLVEQLGLRWLCVAADAPATS